LIEGGRLGAEIKFSFFSMPWMERKKNPRLAVFFLKFPAYPPILGSNGGRKRKRR
jgi:hypothetical protein